MTKKLAKYKIIENDILKKITLNQYKKDDLIPTEAELSEMYDVSRITVRKATDNLVATGYLKRTPGLGTVVKRNKKTNVEPIIKGFREQMQNLGKSPKSIVKTFVIENATEFIAKKLEINEGDQVYYIERIRMADDEVYIFEKSYISVDKFPELSISYLQESKYNFFQNVKNINIMYQHHVVKAILADEELSNILNIKLNTPIISVQNSICASNDVIIDYSTNFYNPEVYDLCYIKTR
ncbi:MAG: GntR family transcriptional regulator [Marinisporobacter sp.]|nr:GntR family transcriptional regulator [Marinisporobacter sp.]